MALQGSEAAFSAPRLRRLAEDLESDAAAISYASMFLDMLPDRIERILSILQGDDPSAAMDAVLSLKVRSHMVGDWHWNGTAAPWNKACAPAIRPPGK